MRQILTKACCLPARISPYSASVDLLSDKPMRVVQHLRCTQKKRDAREGDPPNVWRRLRLATHEAVYENTGGWFPISRTGTEDDPARRRCGLRSFGRGRSTTKSPPFPGERPALFQSAADRGFEGVSVESSTAFRIHPKVRRAKRR